MKVSTSPSQYNNQQYDQSQQLSAKAMYSGQGLLQTMVVENISEIKQSP